MSVRFRPSAFSIGGHFSEFPDFLRCPFCCAVSPAASNFCNDNIRDYALLQKIMPKLELPPAAEFFNRLVIFEARQQGFSLNQLLNLKLEAESWKLTIFLQIDFAQVFTISSFFIDTGNPYLSFPVLSRFSSI